MKRLIFGLLATLSLSTHATIIEFQKKHSFKKDGVISTNSSKVMAKLGQEFRLPLEGTEGLILKMTVNKSSDATNALTFNGEIIQPKDGKDTIIASPKIITELGKEAKITVNDSKGMSMELTLHPKKLKE